MIEHGEATDGHSGQDLGGIVLGDGGEGMSNSYIFG